MPDDLPLLALAQAAPSDLKFHTYDLVALGVFLVAVLLAGVWFSRRNTTTEMYFLGGHRIPGWAIGLSLVGTSVSSITFLALPAAAFALDYRMIVPNLTLPVVALIAVSCFIPLYRRVATTSAFEYLEKRFGWGIRLYAGITFLIMQSVRLSTVLYLVSIPLAYLTGIPTEWVIVIAGVVIAVYTIIGGIESVIWTDVAQTVVLLGGGLLCLGYIIASLPGGLPKIVEVGMANQKFGVGPIEPSFAERTFFIMLLMGLVNFTTEYASNQNIVQRYLAARSLREARRATLLCAVVSLPTWLLFFFLGTCLFAYYKVTQADVIGSMPADDVLPFFLITQMPPGVAGVIVAGAMAAAMSTLDSSINAMSTIATTDFLKRWLAPGRDDRFYLKAARLFAVVAGVLMITGASLLQLVPKESMANLGFIIMSLFGGVLLGVYLLGFFTTRVDSRAMLIGLAVAVALNIYLAFNHFGWLPGWAELPIHTFANRIILNLVLVSMTYAIALTRGRNARELDGLTVWTTRKPPAEPTPRPGAAAVEPAQE